MADHGNTRSTVFSWLMRASLVLLAGIAILFTAMQLSPRPATWLIARLFDMGSASASSALARHVPAGIESRTGLVYADAPVQLRLDIHQPAVRVVGQTPTVVWIHGGGWISGDKDMLANYLKVLAGHGMTTVSIDYTLAPDAHYPTQVMQANQALGWLRRNADRLGINMKHVFLAGDSAGAQMAAQLGNIVTAPGYARQTGITPELEASRLRGVLLFCGPYDFGMFNWNGALGWPLKNVMWALSGERDFLHHRVMDEGSVLRHVTATFPPAFITVGNADPLRQHSRELATKLAGLHVPVDTLFFADAHEPALNHEYQFNLDGADGKIALAQAVTFIRRESAP